MNEYLEFSYVYDVFMDNIPYSQWSERILYILRKHHISEGIVAELGCGTGTMTELLARAGYDMIGIDHSVDMLDQAMEKRSRSGLSSILYLNQDMREFELYGTVQAVISVCDCMNYILEEDELSAVFRLVHNYLEPDGIFIFDFTTEKKYLGISDTTIAENRKEGSLIWENTYYKEEKINEYEVTLFLPDGEGKYEKYCETHQQRAYELAQISDLLEKAGLQVISAEDGYSPTCADAQSERIVITARKKQAI